MSLYSNLTVVNMHRSAASSTAPPKYVHPTEVIVLIASFTKRCSAQEIQDIIVQGGARYALVNGLLGSIRDTIHVLLKPRQFLVERRQNDDIHAFTELLDMLDRVYELKSYESPRARLRLTRGAIMYTLMSLLDMPVIGAEVRGIVEQNTDTAEGDWEMYKALEPLLLKNSHIDTDDFVDNVDVCGLYDAEDRLVLSAATPYIVSSQLGAESIVDYADVLHCRVEDYDGPEASFVHLREALQFTKFNERWCAFVKVAGSAEYAQRMCTICNDEEPCTVYSPACNHFVSCEDCALDMTSIMGSECGICRTIIPHRLYNISGGVTLSHYTEESAAATAAEPAEPAVAVDDEESYGDDAAVEVMMKLVMQEDYMFPKAVCQNARALHKVGFKNRFLRYLSRVMGTSKSQPPPQSQKQNKKATAGIAPDQYWCVASFSDECDAAAEQITVLPAIDYSMLNFVKDYPEHTVEQVVNMVTIDKVYKEPSGECISCMDDDLELLVMSKCGHQVMCRECLAQNGNRCPLCRSEDNALLSLVPRRPKHKLDDAETTPCDNKRRSIE